MLGSKPCKDMADTRATTVLKWDKLRAEVATLTGEALSEPHAMSVLISFLDDQTRKFTQAYMNEKLDIFRQRVVGFLTNAGGISRDAMVIGSIGRSRRRRTTMRSRRIGTRTSGATARPGLSKAAAREHDAVQQEAASTAAGTITPASARTKLAKEGNMGAKGVLGEKEDKEDLVERETKEELVASRKGQKGTKEATKRAEKEEREEKQKETEAKDRREVPSSVVGLTTPANART